MKKPTVTFRRIHTPTELQQQPMPEAAYNLAIALGYGDLVTVEGFTIRQTRDLLWGDPDVEPREFDGLRYRK